MRETIEWLYKNERSAHEIYTRSADFFKADAEFKSFLDQIAKDEAWHYDLISGASEAFFLLGPVTIPAVYAGKDVREKVTGCFSYIRQKLEERNITKEELIAKVGEAEFSEWNDIFLHFINHFKKGPGEYKILKAGLQAHIREIGMYLQRNLKDHELIEKIRTLPPVWTENILIVDDEEMISGLIKLLLEEEGKIDIAFNGKEALELIKQKYYKLIISDIDMPIMDGMDLFKRAVSQFPGIRKRFLYLTGDIHSGKKLFLDEYDLKYFIKPVKLDELKEEALNMILSR